jgi:hypothetical protein
LRLLTSSFGGSFLGAAWHSHDDGLRLCCTNSGVTAF